MSPEWFTCSTLTCLLHLPGRTTSTTNAAHAWFGANALRGWATCPITQCGFVRISCNPKIVTIATSPQQATDALRQSASADEAVNAPLAMLREQERMTPDELEELRRELDPAIAEADRGEFVEFTAEDIIAEGRARLAKKRKGA